MKIKYSLTLLAFLWAICAISPLDAKSIGFIEIFVSDGEGNKIANDCSNPITINTLPFTASSSTCGQGQNYGANDACFGGIKSAEYFSGEDIVYSFIPTVDMCLTVEVVNNGGSGGSQCVLGPYNCASGAPPGCNSTSNINGNCSCNGCSGGTNSPPAGIALLSDCPDQTSKCVGWDNGGMNLKMCGHEIKAGQRYYIIVSGGGGATSCINFDITVSVADECPFKETELKENVGTGCSQNLGFEEGNFNGWNACTFQGIRESNTQSEWNPPCIDPNNKAICPQCPNVGWDFPDPLSPPINAGMIQCKVPAGGFNPPPFPYPTDPRFTITTGPGFDLQTSNEIPVVSPTGGQFSARLGNYAAHGQAECIWNSFTVDQTNWILIWQYAVVLEDPENTANQHGIFDSPRFYATLTNQSGVEIGCGGKFEQISFQADCDGFEKALDPLCHQPAPDINESNVFYKRWTSVGTDLSAFMGQIVTLKFCTADCGKFGHYGYAYVDVICQAPNPEGYAICNTGQPITLYAPEGFTRYNWYLGSSSNPDSLLGSGDSLFLPSPRNGQLYTVVFETLTGTGCLTQVTDTVTVIDANLDGLDTFVCEGEIIDLYIVANASHPEFMTFRWYDLATNQTWSTGPVLDSQGFVVDKNYTIIVEMSASLGGGCSFIDTITITTAPGFSINFESSCQLSGTRFTVSGQTGSVTSYYWDFGDNTTSSDPQPTHLYTNPGTYEVFLVVNGGLSSCIDTMRTTVPADIPCDFEIWFPNAFTPDIIGDGPSPNNKARVRGRGITKLDLKIFDRWGELIYHSDNIDEAMRTGWNGNYNGIPVDVDTYTWYMTAESECCVGGDSPELFIKGSISVLR